MTEWHKGRCRCFSCNRTWIGMIPDEVIGSSKIECPSCHKLQGEVVQSRTFHFRLEYVSCLNCAKNYGADMKNGFCQEFSKPIDPADVELNQSTAVNCAYWHPSQMPRDKVRADTEEHIRWYEKE